ncbi:MAG: hypothetical protein KF780_04360 [Sphingomonas sp.]|nr:hypothetical protein [Sphingomonas sp.]
MRDMREMLDRWLARVGSIAGLWTLVPPAVVAGLSAYLASGVSRMQALGPFGWLSAGLIALLVYAGVTALFARAKLWRIEARHQSRLMGDSSPFDPMDTVYRDKRLFLRDLAPLGRREVKGKKFINCEIIGPGNAVLDIRSGDNRPFPTMKDNWFYDVNFIQIDLNQEGGRTLHNVVFFPDCDFEGCSLYTMNLLFVHRSNEGFNWITPSVSAPTLALEANPKAETDGE